jgi:hypothetical protein
MSRAFSASPAISGEDDKLQLGTSQSLSNGEQRRATGCRILTVEIEDSYEVQMVQVSKVNSRDFWLPLLLPVLYSHVRRCVWLKCCTSSFPASLFPSFKKEIGFQEVPGSRAAKGCLSQGSAVSSQHSRVNSHPSAVCQHFSVQPSAVLTPTPGVLGKSNFTLLRILYSVPLHKTTPEWPSWE